MIKYYITTNIIVLVLVFFFFFGGGGGIFSTTNVDQSLLNFTLFKGPQYENHAVVHPV